MLIHLVDWSCAVVNSRVNSQVASGREYSTILLFLPSWPYSFFGLLFLSVSWSLQRGIDNNQLFSALGSSWVFTLPADTAEVISPVLRSALVCVNKHTFGSISLYQDNGSRFPSWAYDFPCHELLVRFYVAKHKFTFVEHVSSSVLNSLKIVLKHCGH